jgi:hypothetical protein
VEGLAQPPNIKAMTAKVGAQSNMNYKAGKGHVILHKQKLDFSKMQAKVNTWRKIEGSSNKKASDKMKVIQTPTVMEGPIKGSHVDEQCGVQDSTAS